ncbi:hypothetical protein BKA82DRAFT_4450763 [Pisolithus tinctorius]|nr:hypothetical protein BKA82DRAFT_4450763 [Pisolithus tinctorius]
MAVPSTNVEYMWAVIGGLVTGIYRDSDCPRMECGRASPPLPIAIQCISEREAQLVCRTLQPIVNALPANPSPTQLLAALGDSRNMRNLLHDDEGFHAVVIGAPPGVHRTRESVTRAEGTFKYLKKRHTASFWEALAFVVVKGIEGLMPPLLTSTEMQSPTVSALSKLTQTYQYVPHANSDLSSQVKSPCTWLGRMRRSAEADNWPLVTGQRKLSPCMACALWESPTDECHHVVQLSLRGNVVMRNGAAVV